LNRKLMMFCDPRMCPSGKTCSNVPWNTVASPSLVPFDTRDRGWGVKAGEKLHQGQFLIEYVGELIDDKEVERRLWEVSCFLQFSLHAQPGCPTRGAPSAAARQLHLLTYSLGIDAVSSVNCETGEAIQRAQLLYDGDCTGPHH